METSSDRGSGPRKQLRSPPNYKTRGVQVRLMALVFSILLVLLLMNQARKPQTWAWMWSGQPSNPGAGFKAMLNQPLDNRTAPRPEKTAAPGVVAIARYDGGSTQAQDPAARNRAIGWSKNWEHLERDQHQLLYAALKAAREQGQKQAFLLTTEERDELPGLIEQLDQGWGVYHENARASLAAPQSTLDDAERESWEQLIAQSEAAWRTAAEALAALSIEQALTPGQQTALAETQATLDALALSRIKEGPYTRTYDESSAWYRLFEILQQSDLAELRRQLDPPDVNAIVLGNHADDYRGKLVTIRGKATLGYRVDAPPNLLGAKYFYVLWIRPATGENSPIVAYCLETPPGFPALRNRSGGDTDLDESVVITGYFFKNWVYSAQVDLRDAPLVLAGSPEWTPAAVVVDQTAPWWVYLLGSIGAGVLALAVAGYAWFASTGRTQSGPEDPEKVALHLGSIDDKTVAPAPGEMLRRMAEREAAAPSPSPGEAQPILPSDSDA
ncbi:hypothetical protein [Lignipirellula cremea]|uniref:Uncharacterized protein n=1 Tax=Lignipirellula cremea TaxID=2528010 RepID=A0A518DMP4_9BACT|nr:hypothetical protein [Lignipirellula cremea]QDU93110.1 hypothetical protein Pla8534_08890 [Lignipirellula cremea]